MTARRRVSRRSALTAVALGAAVTFGLAALPWFSAPVAQISGETTVTVSGAGASPVVGALLLVVGAGLVAYLLARGVLARVVAGVIALAGVGVVLACVSALQHPLPALRRLAAETSGVPELAGDVVATPWGWVTTAAAVLLAVAAVALVLAPPAAAGRSRYERPSAASAGTSADRASGTTGEAPHEAAAPAERAGEPGEIDRVAVMDDWDALTRGEDPSR